MKKNGVENNLKTIFKIKKTNKTNMSHCSYQYWAVTKPYKVNIVVHYINTIQEQHCKFEDGIVYKMLIGSYLWWYQFDWDNIRKVMVFDIVKALEECVCIYLCMYVCMDDKLLLIGYAFCKKNYLITMNWKNQK
jgi:hypothetical protein